MKKNSEHNFTTVQVDPISGEYYMVIPEWIVNDQGWYEDTELDFHVDGDEIFITENTE